MQFDLQAVELPVRIRPSEPMTDEALLRFCAENDSLRIEREPNGELTVMTPAGSGSGRANANITTQLSVWADEDGRGTAFDSNAGFRLPDGSMRAPDASWISWPRWNALSREEQRGFAPLCPEFVIELRSPTDRLPDLQVKMGEWIRNGAELAWLVDPERQVVEVYRPGAEQADVLEGVTSVTGEGPVAGFVLELGRIWQ
jgi:Uma2 family endonuclease